VQDRWGSYILAFILIGIGVLLSVSAIVALVIGTPDRFLLALLSVPGRWLFDGFHLASFFVPVYFLLTGALVAVGKGVPARLITLNAAIVPMLLAALPLRLLWDPNALDAAIPAAVARVFTLPGGAALSAALCLLSLIALRALSRRLWRRARTAAAHVGPLEERTAEADVGRTLYLPHVEDDGETRSDVWQRSNGVRAVRSLNDGGVERLRTLVGGNGHRQNGGSGAASRRETTYAGHRQNTTYEEALEELDPVEEETAGYRLHNWDELEETDGVHAAADAPRAGDAADAPHSADAGSAEEPLWVFFSDGRFHDDSGHADHEDAEYRHVDYAYADPDAHGNGPDAHGNGSDAHGNGSDAPAHVLDWEEAELSSDPEDEGPFEEGDELDEDLESAPPRRAQKVPQTYSMPIRELLDSYGSTGYWEIDEETKQAAEVLRVTLEEFQIQAEVTGIRRGPVITMFELLPAPGVKLAKIVNLSDNIALRLAAQSVRIVAPIPGKHAVGIEIPNKRRHIVSFAELLEQDDFQGSDQEIPLALGKDIPGDAQIVDLTKTPHLLIAGATGSGKSVCVNSIICSILFRRRPDEVKMILIDPKIVELKFYNDIPHLLTPVITDPKRAFQALQYLIYEMERRYSLLDSQGVRDVKSYNQKIKRRNLATEPLPYIVVVVDEFADLISTSGKELESTLARLAAMSRAVGIHLVLATQRPSTDVITGLIKANIPSRIAFMVSSKVDSRIIIDSGGAEKLLGQGDMLFTSAWDPFPFRMQGAFLSEEEVDRVVRHVKSLGEPDYIDDEIFIDDDEENPYQQELEDPLLERAIEVVTSAQKASASYLQRRLKIGYNRAARLVEEMERLGIVGPQQGSKPREIIGVSE
jgi:S-DNA-T family DNA segregation ATPase FtsK/SpoIIIE